jgi:preprotein translocase subunit SecF
MKMETKQAHKGMNDQGRFDFMKMAPALSITSLILTILSCVIIFTKGFTYGIDFAGGTEMQVQFASKAPVGEIRNFLETLVGSVMVQTIGEDNELLIRMQIPQGATEKEINEKNNERIRVVTSGLTEKYQIGKDAIRVDSVGPQIGGELKKNGLLAVVYSLLLILIYIALRFDFKYAPGAVLCLFHDTVITLAIFSILGKEVNVQILAAILTIIGYSLNDTIINFDRIREYEHVFKGKAMSFIINRSVNDVLSRTVLTSLTTLLAVVALYTFAGGVIEDLAFTLGIGVIVGTYSSIYVASPLIIVTEKLSKQWGVA